MERLSEEVASKLQVKGETDKELAPPSQRGFYQVTEKNINIQRLTIHTLRTAWIILEHSITYKLDAYLEEGKDFPDVKPFIRFTKYSYLAYLYGMAVGMALSDVVKYEWPASAKKTFGKGTGRPKPEPLALVITALVVMKRYRGINLSRRLFDRTVKAASEARIYKIFSIVDETWKGIFEKMGFKPTDYTPMDLNTIKLTDDDGKPCNFSFMEYTIT